MPSSNHVRGDLRQRPDLVYYAGGNFSVSGTFAAYNNGVSPSEILTLTFTDLTGALGTIEATVDEGYALNPVFGVFFSQW
jgi:hypothetical protein